MSEPTPNSPAVLRFFPPFRGKDASSVAAADTPSGTIPVQDETALRGGLKSVRWTKLGRLAWMSTLEGFVERVLLWLDGSSDTAVAAAKDAWDTDGSAANAYLGASDLGILRDNETRALVSGSDRHLMASLFLDTYSWIGRLVASEYRRKPSGCVTVYKPLVAALYPGDDGSLVRAHAIDLIRTPRDADESAFDWHFANAGSPPDPQTGMIASSASTAVGIDKAASLTTAGDLSQFAKDVVADLYPAGSDELAYAQRVIAQATPLYTEFFAQSANKWILRCMTKHLGDIEDARYGKYLGTDAKAPRLDGIWWAALNDALARLGTVGIFIPDFSVVYVKYDITYSTSVSVGVDEYGDLSVTALRSPAVPQWTTSSSAARTAEYAWEEGMNDGGGDFTQYRVFDAAGMKDTIPVGDTDHTVHFTWEDWVGHDSVTKVIPGGTLRFDKSVFPELSRLIDDDVIVTFFDSGDLSDGAYDGTSRTGTSPFAFPGFEDDPAWADTDASVTYVATGRWTRGYHADTSYGSLTVSPSEYPSDLAFERDYIGGSESYPGHGTLVGYAAWTAECTAGDRDGLKWARVCAPVRSEAKDKSDACVKNLLRHANDEVGAKDVTNPETACVSLVAELEPDGANSMGEMLRRINDVNGRFRTSAQIRSIIETKLAEKTWTGIHPKVALVWRREAGGTYTLFDDGLYGVRIGTDGTTHVLERIVTPKGYALEERTATWGEIPIPVRGESMYENWAYTFRLVNVRTAFDFKWKGIADEVPQN